MSQERERPHKGAEGARETARPAPGKRTRVAERYGELARAMSAGPAGQPPTIHDAATAAVDHKDGGQPVPTPVAATVGAHLNVDFRDVRVHQDPLAQQATAAMSARAFAHGADVFLGAGERADDVLLMAHELTHVAQQGAAATRLPQRQVEVGASDAPAEREADRVAEAVSGGAAPARLIVDDGPVAPGQMLKSQFIEQLRVQVTAAADQELGPIYSAIGCPYIDQYFGRYATEPASAGEALLRRFAPATRSAQTAADLFTPVVARVREGVRHWRETGQPPPELAAADPGVGGVTPAGAQAQRAPDGRTTLGSLEAELGPGTPLDGATAGRMAAALGAEVSHARLHAGPIAARKADEAGALAFTVGPNIVLGAAAPAAGTVEGDALLAHELAHTVQQRDAAADPAARRQPIAGEDPAAEHEANRATAGAVADLRGAKPSLAERLTTSMKTGLQLQRCGGAQQQMRLPHQLQHEGAVTHVSNRITDGPYGWQQEFDVSFSANEVRVVLKPKLAREPDVTEAQADDVKRRARGAYLRIFDNQFVFTDTADSTAYTLRTDVEFVESGEHYTITLRSGNGQANRRRWFVERPDESFAHELGHQLGLKDEYIDADVPGRETATSPNVHTDHSIMGDFVGEGRARAGMHQRHGETIAAEVGGATRRTFTVSRRR